MAITIQYAGTLMWKNTSRALATVPFDLKIVTMQLSVTQPLLMSMINTSTVEVVGACVEIEKFDMLASHLGWIGMIPCVDALALNLGKLLRVTC